MAHAKKELVCLIVRLSPGDSCHQPRKALRMQFFQVRHMTTMVLRSLEFFLFKKINKIK